MTPDEIEQFRSAVASALGQVMRLHDVAIRLSGGAETPQYRINALFSRPLHEPAQQLVRPYKTVVANVAFGFEDGDAFDILLHETPREAGRNQVRLDVQRIGQSRWLSLEIDLPWPPMRTMEHIDITISALASKELACSASLVAFDGGGERHDLGWAWFALQPRRQPITASLDYALPENIPIDFTVEPKLVLFFPVEQFSVDFDYIELRTQS